LFGRLSEIRWDAQRQGLHARDDDVARAAGTTTANSSTTDALQKPVHEPSGRGKSYLLGTHRGVLTALQLDADHLPVRSACGDREVLGMLLAARDDLTVDGTVRTSPLGALLRDGEDARPSARPGRVQREHLYRAHPRGVHGAVAVAVRDG
jgi:hypothetical protein